MLETKSTESIKISVLHTGSVCVSTGLPFKDKTYNPKPYDLLSFMPYGRKRIWIPVSAYLIEHPKGNVLFDTGWGREISPHGTFDRWAQIKHMGIIHYFINQGVLPLGKSVPEQLKNFGLEPKDLDYVIMSHLHGDHASGLQGVKEAKQFLVSTEEYEDTQKYAYRYCKNMWQSIPFTTFHFEETGIGPVGHSFDLFHDGSIELIQIPGHTNGLCCMKINKDEKYVLLFADGGYAEKSWKEMIPPGTALDEDKAFRSLQWIQEAASHPHCIEALATHDPNVIPHTIVL